MVRVLVDEQLHACWDDFGGVAGVTAATGSERLGVVAVRDVCVAADAAASGRRVSHRLGVRDVATIDVEGGVVVLPGVVADVGHGDLLVVEPGFAEVDGVGVVEEAVENFGVVSERVADDVDMVH